MLSSVLVALAFTHDGLPVRDVQLNDGSVWVTNASQLLVGRLNRQIDELNGAVTAGSPSFDVLQDGSTVFVQDSGAGTLTRVDVAYLALSGKATLPPGAQVLLGGGTVVVLDPTSGNLWARSSQTILSLDSTKDAPDRKLGKGASVTVGRDGAVWALSTASRNVWSATLSPSGAPSPWRSQPLPALGADATVTAVGNRPVILDRQRGRLLQPGLPDLVLPADAKGVVLQDPGPASTRVAVATETELMLVPLDGSAVLRAARGTGRPATPVVVGGCVHAAWSGTTSTYVQACNGAPAAVEGIPGANSGASLRFRVNRSVVVLNDVTAGGVWLVDKSMKYVDNWKDVTPKDAGATGAKQKAALTQAQEQQARRNDLNQPPVATDDRFGVRPGRTTVLRVLANDSDPDGDILTVSAFDPPSAGIGRLQSIEGGKALQFTPAAGASGSGTFSYTVSDGRGGKATAQVTLTINPLTQNSPPVLLRSGLVTVEQGASVTYPALSDWVDPNGDDLVLQSAAATTADIVRFQPNGMVTFIDSGTQVGRKVVNLVVSDGIATTAGELVVDVRPKGQLAPVARPDHVVTLVGREVLVTPLTNDSDPGNGALRLSKVDTPADAVVTPDYERGTFLFRGSQARTYYLTYVVANGPMSSTGIVRIDVQAPSGNQPPVAVPDVALLPFGGTALVDVLANDEDADGDVLVVQSVTVPTGSGLRVAVIDHRLLSITTTQELQRPVELTYRVSDGTTSVEGSVSVRSLPGSPKNQPPLAMPDTISVRAGDVVNIPVLSNDSDPDGDALVLVDRLIENVPAGSGLLFVSGDRLRFQAPLQAMSTSAVYAVRDSQGQTAAARITITVRALDPARNSPPAPRPLTARVFAGSTVRITIPLDGLDPDGDSVSLVGPADAPQKGRIVGVGPDWLDYEAYATTGTDQFSYAVRDRLGAGAAGVIRVGIAARPDQNQAPVAADDTVVVRPGRLVQVPVLANDSDPDGDPVTFADPAVDPKAGLDARVAGTRLAIRAPATPGTITVPYSITDGRGGRSSANVTVESRVDAPLLPPIASDDVITATQLSGDPTIDVPVVANDYDPDGARVDLGVSLPVATAQAVILPDQRVRVTLTSQPQAVPYTITDKDGLSASAFIMVPGAQNLPPRLRPGAPPLTVAAGGTLNVNVSDYVVDPEGRPVRLTEPAKARATNSDGSPVVVTPTTLRFTPAPGFFGPAAVSFEVTDGTSLEDPTGQRATLTLSITVTPPSNRPPTFSAPSVDVTPGEAPLAVDLRPFVKDPDPGDLSRLRFAGPLSAPTGIRAQLTGTTLMLTADPSTPKGTSGTVMLTVTDGVTPAVSAPVNVKVTASTRPLAKATDDVVPDANQGTVVVVEVLRNDSNPFPDTPLRVIDASLLTGQGSVSQDGQRVSFTVPRNFVGVATIRYRITDKTGDPSREVDGKITVTVRGRPDAPVAPTVQAVSSGTVVLTWPAPGDNGSPILDYTVRSDRGTTTTCPSTTCTVGGLTNNVEYRFTVSARNAVGSGDPSPPSAVARPDARPDRPNAPQLAFANSALDVTWQAPTSPGSPVVKYQLEISPAASGGSSVEVTGTSYRWPGLTNGQSYQVRVRAFNRAPDPSDWSAYSAPETPSAPPATPQAPKAQAAGGPLGGQASVQWTAPANNGATISSYSLQVFRNGSLTSTVTVPGDQTTRTVTVDNANDYTFRISATNRAGSSAVSAPSATLRPYGKPATIGAVSATPGDRSAALAFTPPSDNGQAIQRYEALVNGGTVVGLPPSKVVGGLTNGQRYSFQVRACNSYCADWSPPSNQVVPYGPPGAPAVSAAAGNINVTFSWSPPAPNGQPINRLEISINGGGWENVGPSAGSRTVGNSGGQTWSIRVRAIDQAGQVGPEATAAASTQPRAVRVSRGGPAPQCAGCYYVIIEIFNFQPGGSWPVYVGDNSGDPTPWPVKVIGANGSGYGRMDPYYYYGYRGTQVWATVDGVRSPDYTWP